MRAAKKHFNIFKSLVLVLTAAFSSLTVRANLGDLDPTFGVGGEVNEYIGPGLWITKVLVQSDGKIVVVGRRKSQLQYQGPVVDVLFIRRYTSTGAFDSNYQTFFPGIGFDAELQSDGKLVVFGQAPHTFDWNGDTINTKSPIVWRFNADGTLDSSFGAGGSRFIDTIQSIDYTNYHLEINAGNIYAAYLSRTPGERPYFYRVTKFSSTGAYGFTFEPAVRYFSNDGGEKRFSMKVDPANGNILVAGAKPLTYESILRRYTNLGQVVTTFGTNGESVLPFCSADTHPTDILIQPDAKILVLRSKDQSGPSCLSRSLANGGVDPNFIVTYGTYSISRNLWLQPDGKMFYYTSSSMWDALKRFNSDGSSDDIFFSGDKYTAQVIQPDQKLVTAEAKCCDFNFIRLRRRLLD
ncbi:MAG: hypothetical protein H7070_06140 [Saprospiraceae bacterium]|nr:hypothetical protein [Pyrinomonadaceae bacterium]